MFKLLSRIILFVTAISFSISGFANVNFTHRRDVQKFIHVMVTKYKFNKKTLTTLFSQVKLRPQVMHHINKPLEKETWGTYQRLFITEAHIEHGMKFWSTYAKALKEAEQTYGVPANIIVATIGVETKYGKYVGNFRVIDALSNIAFSKSPRAKFFQNELKEFLLLTREEHLNPLKVMGSYAGAIGQPQFMPSSYRQYAINFSKSGKIDLMENEVDVIGSIANYYQKHGWLPHQPVTIPIDLNKSNYNYFVEMQKANKSVTLDQLAAHGIITKKPTSDGKVKVKLVTLEAHNNQEYWLAYNNFDVIKRYNPSDLYAMAVFQLGKYISLLRENGHHV